MLFISVSVYVPLAPHPTLFTKFIKGIAEVELLNLELKISQIGDVHIFFFKPQPIVRNECYIYEPFSTGINVPMKQTEVEIVLTLTNWNVCYALFYSNFCIFHLIHAPSCN